LTGYNPDLHHRHSIRLQGYDYSKIGAYFVTVCTKNRECLFGEITDGRMVVNNIGRLIEKWWAELMNKFLFIETDIHVVMPNHFHGIIMNAVGAALCGRPDESRDQKKANHIGKGTHTGKGNHTGLPLQVPKQTSRRHERPALGNIIDWFKTMTTNEYIRGIKLHVWSSFNGKLWQRNYYEHVIRNEKELNGIREYIMNNPIQWALDEENPDLITERQGALMNRESLPARRAFGLIYPQGVRLRRIM
jgi:REP element-mobilizing transposase RayT